jgi:hypothetical protein
MASRVGKATVIFALEQLVKFSKHVWQRLIHYNGIVSGIIRCLTYYGCTECFDVFFYFHVFRRLVTMIILQRYHERQRLVSNLGSYEYWASALKLLVSPQIMDSGPHDIHIRQMRRAGCAHTWRHEYKILVRQPDGKVPLGRCKRRFKDSM